jgi:hypothetical protein
MKEFDTLARHLRVQYEKAERFNKAVGMPETRTVSLLLEHLSEAALNAAEEINTAHKAEILEGISLRDMLRALDPVAIWHKAVEEAAKKVPHGDQSRPAHACEYYVNGGPCTICGKPASDAVVGLAEDALSMTDIGKQIAELSEADRARFWVHFQEGCRQAAASRVKPSAEDTLSTPPASRYSELLNQMVNAFLSWTLPREVSVDTCATRQGPGRSGTNLLTYSQASVMLDTVVGPIVRDLLERAKAPTQFKALDTNGLVLLVQSHLIALSVAQRVEFFTQLQDGYCRHCGINNPHCQCENDE